MEIFSQLGRIFQLAQLVPAFQLMYIMVKFGGAAPISWGGREADHGKDPLG